MSFNLRPNKTVFPHFYPLNIRGYLSSGQVKISHMGGKNSFMILHFSGLTLGLYKGKMITLLILYHINFIDASIYLNVKF